MDKEKGKKTEKAEGKVAKRMYRVLGIHPYVDRRDGEVKKEFVKVGVAFERPSEEGMVLKLSAHSITGEYLIVGQERDSQEGQ